MVSVVEAPGHRDAPPPIDLVGHVRDLARVFLPALLIAAIVGGGVFAYRSTAVDKVYSATVITQITPSTDVVPGDAFVEQLRAPFIGLAADNGVLDEVRSKVDTGWDAATLRSHTTLTPGTSPALLDFTVTADSPDRAQQIARALVTAVSAASDANRARDIARQVTQLESTISAEQDRNATLRAGSSARTESDVTLADLRNRLTVLQSRNGDTLNVLSSPEPSSSPVSPKPVSEGLVAAVVALIVALELLALARGRLGRRPNRIWARRAARRTGARLSFGDDTDEGLPPLLVAALAQRHRRTSRSLLLLGEGAVVDDDVAADRGAETTVTAPLASPWWRADLSDLAFAVVILSARSTDRRAAERALRELAGLGIDRHLVVQRGRRLSGSNSSGSNPSGSNSAGSNSDLPVSAPPFSRIDDRPPSMSLTVPDDSDGTRVR